MLKITTKYVKFGKGQARMLAVYTVEGKRKQFSLPYAYEHDNATNHKTVALHAAANIRHYVPVNAQWSGGPVSKGGGVYEWYALPQEQFAAPLPAPKPR